MPLNVGTVELNHYFSIMSLSQRSSLQRIFCISVWIFPFAAGHRVQEKVGCSCDQAGGDWKRCHQWFWGSSLGNAFSCEYFYFGFISLKSVMQNTNPAPPPFFSTQCTRGIMFMSVGIAWIRKTMWWSWCHGMYDYWSPHSAPLAVLLYP